MCKGKRPLLAYIKEKSQEFNVRQRKHTGEPVKFYKHFSTLRKKTMVVQIEKIE